MVFKILFLWYSIYKKK